MNFIINGAFKEDTSNPSSLPLSILPSSSVILATRKWVYRNFRQKKKEALSSLLTANVLPYLIVKSVLVS